MSSPRRKIRAARTLSSSVAPWAAILAATALISGCGGEVVDHAGAEKELMAELERTLNISADEVACPDGVAVEPDERFRCSARDGVDELELTVKVINRRADLQLISIEDA